ncbi:D-mannonate dehydratase [Alteracholeplasma palmae J233]|uniref:Mannonate dehydratase n=1 Tax=Alteracholeplasma palmae (strain ATCC 49389 / J233) TaxID=1318466 RepID=U4KK83_ALTPJ|nr:mannonate dehydratase [Alteracholeplasma palmae]CCV63957.1 D-mannonate dehydratase [Alteracholeplasma palmae J233]
MKMTFRWFGKKFDSVSLEQIRQVPGVTGVITTLYDTKPGEVWSKEKIASLKKEVEQSGLKIEGIESVNIHDDIKTGGKNRDLYIKNYITTLENLAANDIRLVCYNFMPVFDWTRSDLAKVRKDGSTVLSYDQELVDKIDPDNMFDSISEKANGFILPGWEPERMERIKSLFKEYEHIDENQLFENLVYFLEKIMPTCDKYNIDMAIHPDDPAWKVFGLSRIINSKDNLLKLMKRVNNPHNGVTFCSGSLGSNPKNDLVDIIHSLKGRIHFAHLRNIIYLGEKKFDEAAHLSSDGSLDMYQIVKALYDIGFDGPIRPDHGRAVWNEVSMPGYGLYDRAMGATYLNGLWEAISKSGK